MKNDKLIINLAIDFINAYWSVPYNSKWHLLEYISESIEDGNNGYMLNQFIEMLKNDLYLDCWLLTEIAIPNNDKYHFLDTKLHVYEQDDFDIILVEIQGKYFNLYDEPYSEYKKKIVQVETFQKVVKNENS